jgi:SAM-dependent methyltransferase
MFFRYLPYFTLYSIYQKQTGKNNMNRKIFNHLLEKLRDTFNLPRWNEIRGQIDANTKVLELPWTPKRLEKFRGHITATFDIEADLRGTLAEITTDIDEQYSARFWGGGVWQPRTDVYQYSGWNVVDEINKRQPRAVLDVGCGYNQFKPRIPNLIGIDKYNNCADYMVDILEYNVEPETYDAVIVFGSINFGEYVDVSTRFQKVFELTAPGGRIYVRANPGHVHPNGQWVDIFPWDFESAHRVAKENLAHLITFKKDNGQRLYFCFEK